jgi:Mrp family chromosome partitioning ATPase/uncharacterized protein involved in exopolysaccharide biosynthesis
VLVAAAIVFVGFPLVWWKGSPIYRTDAVVYISPRFAKNLSQDSELDIQSNSQYREFVQQQVRTITRYDIVDEGLKRLGEKRSFWQTPQESERRAAERLMTALDVEPVEDTYLISIALEGQTPDGLAEIVNAVVGVYLEKQKSEEFYGSDVRVGNLQQRRKELLDEITAAVERQTALAQELGVTTFEEKFLNPYDKALIDGNDGLAAARRRRMEAEAKLSALEARHKQQQALELESAAREMAANDRALGDLSTLIAQRRSALVAKLSGMSDEHPGRQKIEHEISELDADLATAADATFKRIHEVLVKKRETAMAEERARMQEEVEQARRIETGLTAEVENQRANVAWFTSRYNEALALRSQIERGRKQLDSIDDRLDFISLESKAPGFVRLVSSARQPEVPTKGNRKKLFLTLVAAACLAGVGCAVAADYWDNQIRTTLDAEQAVGFPAVGWILERSDSQTEGFAVDQVRRLALALDRERRLRGIRRFALTSVKSGGGTSQIVLDLGRTLSDVGVSTIALELNAFKPDLRYQGVAEQSVGIVDVLAGKCSLAEVIVPGNALFPDRIPSGDTRGNRHISTGKDFLALLEELQQHYDILLLDTPPILLSADAELFTGVADAAFLVVGAEAVSTGEVRRATRLLERLAPPVVGFIVNRVQVFGAGGYFADLLKEYETGEKLEPTGLLTRWLRPTQRKHAAPVRAAQWEPVRNGTHGASDDRRDEQHL